MLEKRKEKYVLVQKDNLLAKDSDRAYLKNVTAYKTSSHPKPYDIRLLFPGKTDAQVAEELADYFTEVSNEFSPLEPDQVPVTYDGGLPHLEAHEVAARIIYFRKPKHMVKGNIFPALPGDRLISRQFYTKFKKHYI